jgi:hypothetical protein
MVADLFQKIGTGVNMRYSCDGSGIPTFELNNILIFFIINGFMGSSFRDYSYSFVKDALNSRKPLMAAGCNIGGGCHVWVIDGLASSILPIFLGGDSHLHNNWGWNGQDNGYFLRDVFDPLTNDYRNVKVGVVSRFTLLGI